jgi:hypothetical protein
MKIELEFFEYPKHKPVVDELGCDNLLCFLSSDVFEPVATGLLYKPNGRYIFSNDQRLEFEPYVTHWAYLPKKV